MLFIQLNYEQLKHKMRVVSMQDNELQFAHCMQLESSVFEWGDSDSAHTIQIKSVSHEKLT